MRQPLDQGRLLAQQRRLRAANEDHRDALGWLDIRLLARVADARDDLLNQREVLLCRWIESRHVGQPLRQWTRRHGAVVRRDRARREAGGAARIQRERQRRGPRRDDQRGGWALRPRALGVEMLPDLLSDVGHEGMQQAHARSSTARRICAVPSRCAASCNCTLAISRYQSQ